MYWLLLSIAMMCFIGCKDVGFRELPDASEQASSTSAAEAMQSVESALEQYKQRKGTAFSLREFHERALKESGVPLPTLDRLLQ